jgi:formamidopyrimidine-DNA glycosylase
MIYVSNEGTSQAGGGHPSDSLKHGQPGKHTRVCIELDSGGSILFNDQRKFGYIKSIPSSKLDEDTFLKTLGPEPWDEAFSSTYLRDVCQRRKQTAIKQVILDQKVVAGFGNIYVDEALFLAGIRPTRKAGRIAKKSLGRLIEHGREVLERGIEFGGVSVSDYVNAEGLRGTMQRQLYVYNRANEPCKQCETPIRKITVAGRGTHYCPNCQH